MRHPVRAALFLAAVWATAAPPWLSAQPALRASLTASLKTDVDQSQTITCGDILEYALTLSPSGNGTPLAGVVFEISVDSNLLFDPATVVAGNGNGLPPVVDADPLRVSITFGTVCNSPGCPSPAAHATFDGRIRVLNTGSAVSVQGRVSGTNFPAVFTDGTDNPQIEPTVTPYVPCPPLPNVRAAKTYSLAVDADGDGLVDPGDTLRYTVLLTNSVQPTAPAAGVVFDSDPPAHGTLVPGSVVTNRGTVAQGNSPGATHVRVNVGSLAVNQTATLSYQVLVAASVPANVSEISSQGTVSSTAGSFPIRPTDDPTTPAALDPTRTPLDFDPDLALGKTDGGASASPGGTVAYTLTVTNLSSREAASGVVLADTLPAHTSLAAGSSPGWACAAGVCRMTVRALGAGESQSRTLAVTVSDPLPAGAGDLANTARASEDGSHGPEPDLGNNFAFDTTPLAGAGPDLAIAKSDGGISVSPGGTVAYTLTASNLGNRGATGVTLSETVPAHSTFSPAASSPGWACSAGSCTYPAGSLAGRGGSTSAVFAVTVASSLPAGVTALANTATVVDDGDNGPDLDPGNNSAIDSTPLTGAAPALALTKDLAPGSTPVPGGLLLWTLGYANTGNQDAALVVLSEIVPASTTFEAASSTSGWTCTPGPGAGASCRFSIGSVPAGASGAVTFALRIAPSLPAGSAAVPNCAQIGPSAGPPEAQACATANLAAAPDLRLGKDDGGAVAEVGTQVVYTLTYSNAGTRGATGVRLTETVPEHTTFVPALSTPGWICSSISSGGTCTLERGALVAGGAGSAVFGLLLHAPIPEGVAAITNTASIGDDGLNGPDAAPGDNTATDTTPLLPQGPEPQPVLSATKRDALTGDLQGDGQVSPGDTVTYTVTITNTGPGGSKNTRYLVNDLDPNSELVIGSVAVSQGSVLSGNASGDGTVAVSLGGIPGGGAALVTFDVRVKDDLPPEVEELVCQGLALAANHPSVLTDDPDTEEPDDPTLTPIGRGSEPPVHSIPTLGSLGAALLCLALAAGAVFFLRRRRLPVEARGLETI